MSDKTIMIMAVLACILIMLAGCSPDRSEPVIQTQDIMIPYGEIAEAPMVLARTPVTVSALPQFIFPRDPQSMSCLSVEGEARLQALLNDRESHLDAWEKWGFSK